MQRWDVLLQLSSNNARIKGRDRYGRYVVSLPQSSHRAHVDFIFYRTIDKSLVLEFEINGSQHDRVVQIRRDKTKSRILRKASIPQVVIRTNEELEEATRMISEALENALRAGQDSQRRLADREALSVAIKTEEEPWSLPSELLAELVDPRCILAAMFHVKHLYDCRRLLRQVFHVKRRALA